MNHYINMLEPSECVYISSAEANPVYKLAAVAVAVALIGFGVLNYQGLQSTIEEGASLESWLKTNSEQVEEAAERFADHQRLKRAQTTLTGWRDTRYAYSPLLAHIGSRVPDPVDQTQFTSLSFNEEIIGLRILREQPASGQTRTYPLERQVRLRLTGLVRDTRPSLKLDQYKALLELGEDRPPIEDITMRLQPVRVRPGEDSGIPEGATPFSAQFSLENRTMVAP
jgi:hypothetical protein